MSTSGLAAVTLRPMRWWDVEAAAALEPELFPAAPWTAAGFWSELAGVPQTRYYVVAEDARASSATPACSWWVPRPTCRRWPCARTGRAPGSAEPWSRTCSTRRARRGCSRVLLEVREDNAAARHLYDRLGFEQVAVRRGYYGPGRDAVVMRLRLAPAVTGETT